MSWFGSRPKNLEFECIWTHQVHLGPIKLKPDTKNGGQFFRFRYQAVIQAVTLRLLAMINESNVQKTRYEMEDDPNAGDALACMTYFGAVVFGRVNCDSAQFLDFSELYIAAGSQLLDSSVPVSRFLLSKLGFV